MKRLLVFHALSVLFWGVSLRTDLLILTVLCSSDLGLEKSKRLVAAGFRRLQYLAEVLSQFLIQFKDTGGNRGDCRRLSILGFKQLNQTRCQGPDFWRREPRHIMVLRF